MTIGDKIFRSLDDAVDNGYDLDAWPAAEIAQDLYAYDSEFEEVPPSKLIPYVEAWLLGRAKSLLRKKVWDLLDLAVAAEYPLDEWTAAEVVEDMRADVEEFEAFTAAAVLPHVVSYKKARGA